MKSRLLFLGPPGAGKGTQAQRICTTNGFMHLSTGDLLRKEVSLGTDLGKEADEIMSRGELVSDSMVLSIVQRNLNSDNSGWVLDGFPRTVVQAQSLGELLNEINQPIDAVILLQLNDQDLIKRLISRGREDDSEEIIQNRLEVYRQKTEPLIDYYRAHGLLVGIEASGSIEEISARIEAILN